MEKSKEQKSLEKAYEQKVKEYTPTHCLGKEMAKAFFVGGAICCIGQWIVMMAESYGLGKEDAATVCTISLILLSVMLTGFNLYPKIAKYGGAGALVPITGFANSVAAPAIEFQKEGQVFGIGCKIFTISGPVILYGIFSSWVLGAVYWLSTVIM